MGLERQRRRGVQTSKNALYTDFKSSLSNFDELYTYRLAELLGPVFEDKNLKTLDEKLVKRKIV